MARVGTVFAVIQVCSSILALQPQSFSCFTTDMALHAQPLPRTFQSFLVGLPAQDGG
jgi:hypothetical protein